MFVSTRRPVARRGPSRRISAGPRRKTVWARSLSGTINVPAATFMPSIKLLDPLEVAGSSTLGVTVVRSHIRLALTSPTTDTRPSLVWGLLVFDEIVPNRPNPSSDLNTDWMHWAFLDPSTSMTSFLATSTVFWGETYDIKSQRRIHQLNDALFFTLQNQGSATLSVFVAASILLKLP